MRTRAHRLGPALAAAALGSVLAAAPQTPAFYPIDQVRPGQVGVGRTIFAGDTLEEFSVHVIGVLKHVIGPERNLILARLEGGPLAATGVIQGMSGSPVFLDGRIAGAVSYSLGSFPKEPIAGITPIGEMTEAVQTGGPRSPAVDLRVDWLHGAPDAFGALARLAARARAPLGGGSTAAIVGPASLADLVPALRPIGAAMIVSGVDPDVGGRLHAALGTAPTVQTPARPAAQSSAGPPLRPGDAVGISLVRGAMEMGATGTVTWVDGNRVLAFGHPFLNLGPTTFSMTRAHVLTVLPSLDSSMKIAGLGPVIGTISQDRATAVGGTLGAGPREVEIALTLSSDRGPDRRHIFHVLRDETLTPLFSLVAVLNSLTSYERQMGALTMAVRGTVSFGADGAATVENRFSGEGVAMAAASALVQSIGAAAANDFRAVMPDRAEFHVRVSEKMEGTVIERAWLDTTRPRFGETHTVHVLLRDYRGDTETVAIPVTMPAQAAGPLTLLVSDAPTLSALEQRELRPGGPANWPALLARLNDTRRNSSLYVRLIGARTGTVAGGETLPALPGSVRAVLDTDVSTTAVPLSRAVVGAWDRPLDRVIRGSREITITLTPRS